MSTRLFLIGSLISISMISSSAFAQKTDLTTVTCTDFIKMDSSNTTNVVTWLQGYYTYEDDRVVVDSDKVQAKAAQIKNYCADHGDTDLVSASAIFMDKKYNTTATNAGATIPASAATTTTSTLHPPN